MSTTIRPATSQLGRPRRAPLGATLERVVDTRQSRRGKPNAVAVCSALGLSLAMVVVLVKTALLPFPVSTVGEFARWLLRLNLVAAPDLSFVAGLTALAVVVSLGLRRWPRVEARAWRPACAATFALAAVYAVASIPMYKVTMVPFTIRLLSFVGGPGVMVSSVTPYLPPGMLLALFAAPVAVALGPWAARRWPLDILASRCGMKTLAVAAALVAANGAVCRHYVMGTWTDPNRWERRIAQSPHWVLLHSCVEELAKDRPFTHSYSFDAIDDSDFRRPNSVGPDGMPPLLAAGKRPKNVLLIVLESTAAEFFGVMGSPWPTTPNLDVLAARNGVVFENVYSQAASSCKSLVALTNSTYPRPDWLLIVRDHPDFDVPALPQVLRDRGYRSCYAHSGYWSWQGRDLFLLARGVDQLVDASDKPHEQINSWGINDEAMYQGVLDWIDAEPGRPFFAFAYTNETHHPYVTPQVPFDFGAVDVEFGRYLNSVRGADAKINWLLTQLERRGLLDSTLVAITADHGESFGQHNQWTHAFGVYEQTVHVPLLLLHPALADLPRRNAAVGQHIDIAPTLLDLLDIPAPVEWQGRSLLRPDAGERAYFMSVGNEVTLGLRDATYKYHYYVDTQREELFDLAADPQELENLAEKQPDKCAAYRRRVGGWVTYQREFLAKHGVR
ncbi:MAG TPA: sulfatase [Pirellulales bacterium]|jgi:arylsulfatase A-like enzyme|nr:sulfatase [Pirellulales bacterium]